MAEGIDSLAQEIRRVDGAHSLGAGALSEALQPWLAAHDREVAAKALRDAADEQPWEMGRGREVVRWLRARADRIESQANEKGADEHPASCENCGHYSDCALHNAPAFAPGPCTCKPRDIPGFEGTREALVRVPRRVRD